MNLGIWPTYPIVLDFCSSSHLETHNEDNAISALEHPNRVCSVRLDASGSQLENMATVMQNPFPVLTLLDIYSRDDYVPVFPAEFLGGSAPCLQEIYLHGIPLPSLPKFLLSASVLDQLRLLSLRDLSPTDYISPEEMVACLAALPKLEDLTIKFLWATPPDRIRSPPVTRIVIPALTTFVFEGASGYLEDLVALIDSPQLNRIVIDYLDYPFDFQLAQLSKFIDRLVGPGHHELTPFRRANVRLLGTHVLLTLYRHANHPGWDRCPVGITIICENVTSDWHTHHMAWALSQFSGTLSNLVHHLKFDVSVFDPENMDDAEWLHLLHRFSAVQTLYVSHTSARRVALALEDIPAEMVAEVLPSLHLICLAGQPTSSIQKFIAVRRLSGRPVTVIDTETEYERLVSHQ
jgi:hypothetical protein